MPIAPTNMLPFGRLLPVAMRVVCLAVATALSGCAGLQPLPVDAGHAAHGSWVTLQGVQGAEVSPGVRVELRDAPYRARFADLNGIYYQASQRVVYKTIHGVSTEVEGGLYVRFDQPSAAVIWTEPLWGSATMTYPQLFPVKRFTPALNGSTP